LLTLPGVDRAIDPQGLAAYLELGYVPAPLSMFGGIRKLSVASLMKIDASGVAIERYWSPPVAVDRQVPPSEWIEQVRERLEESVRMQMVSDVPIGAFLSGGIDSSAVLAFMARHSGVPVKTYSIGFDGGAAERFNEPSRRARSRAASAPITTKSSSSPTSRGSCRSFSAPDEPVADSAS
jgi:asparagine synthase (glutamine-hydrolysing)